MQVEPKTTMLTTKQFAIRFLGWVLLALLLLLGTKSKAQSNVQVYQLGHWDKQLIRETKITISATVIDKYYNKGFYWVIGTNQNTTYAILIVCIDEWAKYKEGGLIIVRNALPLQTNQWRRKELKK